MCVDPLDQSVKEFKHKEKKCSEMLDNIYNMFENHQYAGQEHFSDDLPF